MFSSKFQRDIQESAELERSGLLNCRMLSDFAYLHQGLLLRAVRGLLLTCSSPDAAELDTSMEQHISACYPNEAELWTKKVSKNSLFSFWTVVFPLKKGFVENIF